MTPSGLNHSPVGSAATVLPDGNQYRMFSVPSPGRSARSALASEFTHSFHCRFLSTASQRTGASECLTKTATTANTRHDHRRNSLATSEDRRALGAALTTLGALAALPAFAQDVPTPAAPGAPQPGPATQPPPAPGTTQPAPTQTPPPGAPPSASAPATPPPNYGLQYNGLFDGYYLFQFNNPKDAETIKGRVYDVRHNSPTLALGELNVFQNPRPSGFGFKATLDVGDTANINVAQPANSSSTNGEGRFKNLGQFYGTYAIGGSGSGVDFGKFYSPFGYEVVQSNGNYNYSRSIPFSIVPFYHFGARLYSAPGVLGARA